VNTIISETYRQLNKQLHDLRPDYGSYGKRWADMAIGMVLEKKAQSFLDYGCGKQTLSRVMGWKWRMELGSPYPLKLVDYDPALPGLDATPEPADVVFCTDVLEHIEPDHLDAVLADLQRVTRNAGFLTVATRPAVKSLPDGRNAHLIQKPWYWWAEKIDHVFVVNVCEPADGMEVRFWIEARPQPAKNGAMS